MPALVKEQMFDYVAHVAKEGGSVVELSGTIECDCAGDVYKWLLNRARELEGYLANQKISLSTYDQAKGETLVADVDTQLPLLPAPVTPLPTPTVVEVPTVFADRSVFGEYTDVFKGARVLKWKPTKE